MKKLHYIAAVLLLALTFQTMGQDTEKESKFEKVSAGFVVGRDFSTLSQTEDLPIDGLSYGYRTLFNYTVGGTFVVKFTKDLEASASLTYSQRNFERTETCLTCDQVWTPVAKFNMNYIDLPLTFQYYITNDRLDVFLSAGMLSSFLAKAKETRPNYKGEEFVYQANDQFNRFTFGVMAGAGINYNLSYRNSIGLNLYYKSLATPLMDSPEVKYSGLNFTAGYLYMF